MISVGRAGYGCGFDNDFVMTTAVVAVARYLLARMDIADSSLLLDLVKMIGDVNMISSRSITKRYECRRRSNVRGKTVFEVNLLYSGHALHNVIKLQGGVGRKNELLYRSPTPRAIVLHHCSVSNGVNPC